MSERIDDGGDCKLLDALMAIWRSLDDYGRCELVGEAQRIANPDKLIGGPFDGLVVPDDLLAQCWANVDLGDYRVAVYVRGKDGRLAFKEVRRTGEGCHPDIWPNKLQGAAQ